MADMDENRAAAIVKKMIDVLNQEDIKASQRLAVASMYFTVELASAFKAGCIDKKHNIDEVLNGCFEIVRNGVKDAIESGEAIILTVGGDC